MDRNERVTAMLLNHCFVRVDDIEEALAFYRDVVGLPVHTDVTLDDGYRWTTVAVPAQPGLEICLEVEGCAPGMTDDDRAAMRQLRLKGLLDALIFQVEDVDAVFERVRASGAEVLQEPTDQFYGVRDCAFRDPAGNMVRFNQAVRGG